MSVCRHNWLVSSEEQAFRCVAGCKGTLPLSYLATLDREAVPDLDAAYALLSKSASEASVPQIDNASTAPMLPLSERKVCTQCKEVKALSEFHIRTRSADGLQSVCKPCNVARVSESRRHRRGRILAALVHADAPLGWGE